MIGYSLPRTDGLDKVTGRARYTADLKFPGMLYGKLLRSPIAAGRILSINLERAASVPGVMTILTAADLEGIDPYFGHAVRDRPILAIDRVRYMGEPVAAIAAVDEYAAEEAVGLIEVQYAEEPAVFDPEQALTPDAPLVHERKYSEGGFHGLQLHDSGRLSNICFRHYESYGDADQAMSEAAFVHEQVYYFPSIYHYAMEPHAALADWTGQGVQVIASAQHPFIVRQEIAEMFRLPLNDVRVKTPYIGGGFGSKSYTKIEPIAVALSRKAGRPVLLNLSVEEAFHTNRRHAAVMRLKFGVDRNGKLLARQCQVILNTGAYADNGPRVAHWAAQEVLGLYECPNDSVESLAVYTNTPPAGSFRAIGGPQTVWACESHMDAMARLLGMDRLEFRLMNLPERGQILRPGRKPIEVDMKSGLRLAAKRAGWRNEKDEDGHAWGIGGFLGEAGATSVSVALMRLHADGTVTVSVGTSELGQGARTVLTQIAATELGVPVASIQIQNSDSESVPFDRSTGASRSTTVMGSAVQEAAKDLLQQLRQLTQQLLPDHGWPEEEAARLAFFARLVREFYGMSGGELIARGYGGPHGLQRLDTVPVFWEAAYGVAKIRVDEETGQIHVTEYTTAAEVGKAINPKLVEGQEAGAFLMGLGNTLYEEIVEDSGAIRNPNLIDYRVPTFEDLPGSFQSILIENQDGPGPYGSRGVGEGSLSPVGPAVANALCSLVGRQADRLPLTPERVWRMIQRNHSG